MINVMYALEPDYRKRLWPVLAARWNLPACWSSPGAMAARRHLARSRNSIRVRWAGTPTRSCRRSLSRTGRHAALATCYRITEGDKVISEEEIIGYAYSPAWDVIQRELVSAGFTQTEGAERLLAWRLA